MESFNYLSVLISIILGLAIAQVLQGLRGLILSRKQVKLSAPTVVWTGMAFLLAIQGWWAAFSMHQQAIWNFFGLLVIVLQAISVFCYSIGTTRPERRHSYRFARTLFRSSTLVLRRSAQNALHLQLIEGVGSLRSTSFAAGPELSICVRTHVHWRHHPAPGVVS